MSETIDTDSFAGGGGASLGMEMGLGRSPAVAINHDAEAIAMHAANHPDTEHLVTNIWRVDPADATRGRKVRLAWFSPDCKHFSKAKGGKPVKKSIRDLAWVVVLWAQRVRPDIIMLENVEEFADWGPLLDNNMPCPERRGLTFRRWVNELKKLGYKAEWRELRACDYGAPTIRKRLFMIARRDGNPIVWPAPTHGPGLLPYRTAAEIIDWSLPCPSIFLTREEGRAIGVNRPLADATMARIAKGVWRYVIDAAEPFIVNLTHHGGDRTEPMSEPLNTVTGANRGEKAFVTPRLVPRYGRSLAAAHLTKFRANSIGSSMDEPVHTVTANSFIKRAGGAAPIGVVAAFLAQHNNHRGGDPHVGRSVEAPVSTLTTSGSHQSVVAAHMLSLKGSDRRMSGVDEPAATVTAGGLHIAEVRAFLMKYYGASVGQEATDPLHTVRTHDNIALVMVKGEPYEIVDIGMRMLSPRELFRAQGFPNTYIIDPPFNGKPMTKTAQIRMCGNSVCPPVVAALTRANIGAASENVEAA